MKPIQNETSEDQVNDYICVFIRSAGKSFFLKKVALPKKFGEGALNSFYSAVVKKYPAC